jgi:hypothetical protein
MLPYDDMQKLARLCSELPGGGLPLPDSSHAHCGHLTGIERVGADSHGPYGVHICRDGCVAAARGGGVLPRHATAVAEELRWHDRCRFAALHSALRPAGSMLVDLARLAEVAWSMPGCTVKPEDKAMPDTVQLVFAGASLVDTVWGGVRYNDDVVVDVNAAGHMRARIRRRDMGGGLAGFSSSKPELAEKVLEKLLWAQATMSADAADVAADFGANYLFTSRVLT